MRKVIEITNQQYLKLYGLYSIYQCKENAGSEWNINNVKVAQNAFVDYCTELGISDDIGQKLALHVWSNFDYIKQLAEAEKICASIANT